MPPTRIAAALLAGLCVWISGCAGATGTPAQPTTAASTSSPAATVAATPAPSALAPTGTPWPTIQPQPALGDALTCGDGTPSFPAAQVNVPPDAERGTDGPSTALKAVLANQGQNPDPASRAGWRRVLLNGTDALFISAPSFDSRSVFVWLTSTGAGQAVAGWFFRSSGDCRLEVDFGAGVRRAELALAPGVRIDPADRAIRLLLQELSCASGKSPAGRVVEPRIVYEPDRILVAIAIRALPGPQDCQGAEPYAYTLQLTEPAGSRQLLDAARVPPVAVVVR